MANNYEDKSASATQQARKVGLLARERLTLAGRLLKPASPEVQDAVDEVLASKSVDQELNRLAPWERFSGETDYVIYLIFNPDRPDDVGWLYIEADLSATEDDPQKPEDAKPSNSVFAVGSGANSQNMRLSDCAALRLIRVDPTHPIRTIYKSGGAFNDDPSGGMTLESRLEEQEFISRCDGLLSRFGAVPFATYAGSLDEDANGGAVGASQAPAGSGAASSADEAGPAASAAETPIDDEEDTNL
ncbi:hypothetical protein AD951_07630 [Acetobacter malorum]|uniref:Uncharacterized protein n=1 Tax=Acetobacter malorum TaxID=178901 RepID=A0A149UMJ6_9PROT|nr:hypothetical protein [Acetobacter malorum]KXV69201.1 hypothetical protein AD951_07630 [Acetobacter malorum]